MGQARKQTASGDTGGRAGRLAAGRRPDRSVDRDAPAKTSAKKKAASKPASKRGKKSASSSSPLARAFKLVLLLAFMAVLGFAIVLIVDVGATLVGGVRFGDVTFADLLDKVSDRVLDRDVPEPKKAKAKPATAPTTKPKTRASSASSASASSSSASSETRAPAPAPTPDEYVKHVEPRRDPEVEQAKARLDQLLKGL